MSWLFKFGAVSLFLLLAVCSSGCSSSSVTSSKGIRPVVPTTSAPAGGNPLSGASRLTLNSTIWTAGSEVTVSGGNCRSNDSGDFGITQDRNVGPEATYPFGESLLWNEVTQDGGGRWTATWVVPTVIIGPARLSGSCYDRSGAIVTSYQPQSIMIETPYRLLITPSSSVEAGGSIEVASVGGGCDQISTPEVNLWSSTSPSSLPTPDAVSGKVGGGEWTIVLPVPSDTPPGDYYVVSRCQYSRGIRVTYQPAPITVTG
jgi:hypothetical protein